MSPTTTKSSADKDTTEKDIGRSLVVGNSYLRQYTVIRQNIGEKVEVTMTAQTMVEQF